MRNQNLRKLAMNAKNRLIKKDQIVGKNSRNVFNSNFKFKIISNEDASFIEKAKSIIDKDISNPIKQLIDNSYFEKLDPCEKQKHLFDIIDKYSKFRKDYEKQKEIQKFG